MTTKTIEHIKAEDLPPDLAKQFGLKDGDIVNLTATPAKPERKFDHDAFWNAVHAIRAMPVKDDRTADEILGYDDNGLPS